MGAKMEARPLMTLARYHAIPRIACLLTFILAFSGKANWCKAQGHVSLQPLARQVRQVEDALSYLGQPVPRDDQELINSAIGSDDEAASIRHLEQVLDKYVLAIVEINAESRVKVQAGPAKPELVEAGTRLFLIKVINKAGVTAALRPESPNALPVFV